MDNGSWFHSFGPAIVQKYGELTIKMKTQLGKRTQSKKHINLLKVFLGVTTVFDFTRPLGVFHQKKIVFRLPSIIDTICGNA